jgi:WD40 repeat protein
MTFKRRTVFRGHGAPVYAVATDDQFIYSGSGDHYVTRWNVQTGLQDTFAIKLEQAPYCLLIATNVLYIGTANGTLAAISISDKQLLWEYNYSGRALFSLLETNQGVLFGDDAGNLCLISTTGKKLFAFPLDEGKIKALSATRTHVYAGCASGWVLEFDNSNFNETNRWKLHDSQVNAIAFQDELLISVGRDGHLVILDRVTNAVTKRIPAHYQSIYGMLHMNEHWITCSMDKTIKIWNSSLDTVLQKITVKEGGHSRSVNALCAFQNANFVSCSDDKNLICWEKVVDPWNN